MNTNASISPAELNGDIEQFNRQYDKDRQVYTAWLGMVWGSTTVLVALFAILTSLESLRDLSVVSAFMPVPFILLAFRYLPETKEVRKPLLLSFIATAVGWMSVGLAFSVEGVGLADKKDITELVAPEVSQAMIDATRDTEEAAVKAAVERARQNPSPATFLTLIPYLDKDRTNVVLENGEVRNTSAYVRGVLWSDKTLLFQTLHQEAMTMASLLPADAVAPEQVQVNVAMRLEFALKNLISFHSEQVMRKSFETPTVGVNILVESDSDELEYGVSNREVGITFPFGDYMLGDTIKINASVVEELLTEIRKDLNY
ncbi:MAG: hypothetical protein ACO3N7_02065 [Kiritimatiellia bacterium]